MKLVDTYTTRLQDDLAAGASLADAMRDLSLAHADHLKALGPIRVLAVDPCPRCGGTVIASETEAKCAAGCGWSRRRLGAES